MGSEGSVELHEATGGQHDPGLGEYQGSGRQDDRLRRVAHQQYDQVQLSQQILCPRTVRIRRPIGRKLEAMDSGGQHITQFAFQLPARHQHQKSDDPGSDELSGVPYS